MLLRCHVQVCLNVKELLGWSRRHIWSLSDSNRIWTHNHLVRKQTLNHLAKLPNDWVVLWVLICIWLFVIIMSHMSFRVNLHSIVAWMSVKALLETHHIWSLSDGSGIQTHNHLVLKWILNHVAKLVKWLSCVVTTYLHSAIDCMLLPCHIQVSKWMYTL